jgi:hypothetical protein
MNLLCSLRLYLPVLLTRILSLSVCRWSTGGGGDVDDHAPPSVEPAENSVSENSSPIVESHPSLLLKAELGGR